MDPKLKIFIAMSADSTDLPGPFQVKYSGEFAERKFIPHITNLKNGTYSCRDACREYRKAYNLDHSDEIAGIMKFPSVLPEMIDDAEAYIKEKLPSHDVMLIIGVHPDIILELINMANAAGCKAIIAPREDPFWMTPSFVKTLEKKCEQKGLEYAFPRPFCSLTKGKHDFINRFIDQFGIGKPQYQVFLDRDGKIAKVKVLRSSPCGATYHVASGLIGIDKEKLVEYANKLWHTYPCLSSSKMDPEINDSPMHMAAYINLNTAKQAEKEAEQEA